MFHLMVMFGFEGLVFQEVSFYDDPEFACALDIVEDCRKLDDECPSNSMMVTQKMEKKVEEKIEEKKGGGENEGEAIWNRWFLSRDGRFWWKIGEKWWRHEEDDLWTSRSRNKESGRAEWRGVNPCDEATWYE